MRVGGKIKVYVDSSPPLNLLNARQGEGTRSKGGVVFDKEGNERVLIDAVEPCGEEKASKLGLRLFSLRPSPEGSNF